MGRLSGRTPLGRWSTRPYKRASRHRRLDAMAGGPWPRYFHDAYSAPGVTAALFQRFLTARWSYQGSLGSLAMFELFPNRPLLERPRSTERGWSAGLLKLRSERRHQGRTQA